MMMKGYAHGPLYAVCAALLVLGLAFGSTTKIVHAALPPGFSDVVIADVDAPTALAFTPDGRILITTQPGQLRVYRNGALLAAPALNLSLNDRICSNSERGLLGVAVDPTFAQNGFIYVYYTFNRAGACVNRVSRFVLGDNNRAALTSEVVLIDNIPSPAGNHNAGDVQFGKDGLLYISVGDGGCDYKGDSGCAGANDAARDRNVLLGKILRITRRGAIPAGNPFRGANSARCNRTGRTAAGRNCQETFARGLRNPFRIAFDDDATSTRFFINDVGQNIWEEIDVGRAGADYGWNVREGPCPNNQAINCALPPPSLTDPIHAYSHSTGCESITGGSFVPAGLWPSEYDNAYLYSDFVCGKIFSLTPGPAGGFNSVEFATDLGARSAVTLTFGRFGATQALYYTTFNNGGQVRRISHSGSAQ
jgi:glucose/arabinose dehydrogenase